MASNPVFESEAPPRSAAAAPVASATSNDTFEVESTPSASPQKRGARPRLPDSASWKAGGDVKNGKPSDVENDASRPKKVAEFTHQMTNDELSDLTYAFQACDADNGGALEADELHALIAICGGEVSLEEVTQLLRESKVNFEEWTAAHDEDTVLPESMLCGPGQSGGNSLENHGAHGETLYGGKRHHAEISIQKQSVLHNAVSAVGRHPLMKPITVPMSYTKTVAAMSYKLSLGRVIHKKHGKDVEDEEIPEESEVEEDHMSFAEFVHMMGTEELLEKYAPGAWHTRANCVRKYRAAFDTADVDGSNTVELDELEMVVLGMDATHILSHADMTFLWDVLTGHIVADVKPSEINFAQFLLGMVDVQRQSRCEGWMDVDKPAKWELLSLLIDTPTAKDDEQNILDALPGIEKLGIKMIHRHDPVSKDKMRTVLGRLGKGTLRKLEPEQLKRMKDLRWRAIYLSGLIGLLCTIIPAAMENYLCWDLGVDGFKDAYWVW
jgi:Ca2+-binding EF-hand superfamily protein